MVGYFFDKKHKKSKVEENKKPNTIMKKSKSIFNSLLIWIKSSKPSKSILYEFKEKITYKYGLFVDTKTNTEYIFKLKNFEFKDERFYIYKPSNIVTGFGYLGSIVLYKQFWKRVLYP